MKRRGFSWWSFIFIFTMSLLGRFLLQAPLKFAAIQYLLCSSKRSLKWQESESSVQQYPATSGPSHNILERPAACWATLGINGIDLLQVPADPELVGNEIRSSET